MALLISCWFIIERIIIPNGFLKWFYLSFYIHPLFLLFCQIFLWLKLLQRWLLFLFFFPFRVFRFLGLWILIFSKRLSLFFSSSLSTRSPSTEETLEENEIPDMRTRNETVVSSCSWTSACVSYRVDGYENELQAKVFEKGTDNILGAVHWIDQSLKEESVDTREDQCLDDKHLSSGCATSPPFTNEEDIMSSSSDHAETSTLYGRDVEWSMGDLDDMPTPFSPISGSVLSGTDLEQIIEYDLPSICGSRSLLLDAEGETDSFYKKYAERMKWFDVLCRDRLYGLNAILKKDSSDVPISTLDHVGTEPAGFFIQNGVSSWRKMVKKRLVRSLESDIELVFVAQTCLSWEALHYQYRKVDALVCSTSQPVVFSSDVADRFLNFQILLERFLEDKPRKGKRHWNFVHTRFSFKRLLQVPEVPEGKTNESMNGEATTMRATEVLKAIENCIRAFWLYVKEDSKKPFWKKSNLLWTPSPVEDPRDLQLLYDLIKTFGKKEQRLKDLMKSRVSRVILMATSPLQGELEKDFLFTMIDVKLVARVLKMSLISTAQLRWCREKLNNIEFIEGKVVRAQTSQLFPSS